MTATSTAFMFTPSAGTSTAKAQPLPQPPVVETAAALIAAPEVISHTRFDRTFRRNRLQLRARRSEKSGLWTLTLGLKNTSGRSLRWSLRVSIDEAGRLHKLLNKLAARSHSS